MGGKTLYFGEIGDSSKTVTSYFERNGARQCGQDENPAEWMLEVTGAVPGSESTQDWSAIWHSSEEHKVVKAELAQMKKRVSQQPAPVNGPDALQSFAASFSTQLQVVVIRVFRHYWRTPSYLYSKVALCFFSVSRIPSKSIANVSNTGPGSFHRVLLLENAQFAPRTTKPNVRHLHAPHNLLQLLPTDYAPFCNPTRPLRGSRTSIQNLFVGNIHSVKYSCRDSLELSHGCARLGRVVLPDQLTTECR